MHTTPPPGAAPGVVRRDGGFARVVDNAPAAYRAAAIEAVNELIEQGEPFTVDHIYDRIPAGLEPHSPNVVPAIIGARARTGRIVPMGRFRTTRPTRHSSKNTMWRAA